MKTFIEYITEAKKFARAKDQDFTNDPQLVLSFVESDEKTYKQSLERSHDSASHGIKHFGEFDPETMRAILTQVKSTIQQFLKDNPDHFCGLLKKLSGFITTDPKEAFRRANLHILANTLDLINDKYILRNKMIDIEKDLVKYIRMIEKNYLRIINDKLKSSVSLDKVSDDQMRDELFKAKRVSFQAWQGTIAVDILLDFTDNSMIISTPDYIRTMYQFDRPASTKEGTIKNFLSKGIKPENKQLNAIMQGI